MPIVKNHRGVKFSTAEEEYVDYDTDGRFGTYIVSTQIPSTDNAHGKND